jgi:hypothetical protein
MPFPGLGIQKFGAPLKPRLISVALVPDQVGALDAFGTTNRFPFVAALFKTAVHIWQVPTNPLQTSGPLPWSSWESLGVG